MRLMEILKKRNRTIFEMEIGMIFTGIIIQIVVLFLAKERLWFSTSLWFGIFLAIAAAHHMYRTLDRALDYDEKNATKLIFQGYVFRYSILVAFIMVILYTKVMNPLIVFLGYMSLKVTVYLQPFTHKLCNSIFHETDPIPEPLPEEEN